MLAKYIRFDSKLDSKIENVRVKIGIADLGYSPVHVAYIARDIPKSLSGTYLQCKKPGKNCCYGVADLDTSKIFFTKWNSNGSFGIDIVTKTIHLGKWLGESKCKSMVNKFGFNWKVRGHFTCK